MKTTRVRNYSRKRKQVNPRLEVPNIPTFNLNVTAETISQATRQHAARCMIAIALRKMGARSISVTVDFVSFNLGELRYIYPLPALAATKLIAFDKGQKVLPFVIRLRNGSARLVWKRGPIRSTSRKTRRKPQAKRCIRRYHGVKVLQLSA